LRVCSYGGNRLPGKILFFTNLRHCATRTAAILSLEGRDTMPIIIHKSGDSLENLRVLCNQVAIQIIADLKKQEIMSIIIAVKGIEPVFGNNCYVAPNATIAGDVVMGDDCSVWFNAVVRGDVNSIRMGNKVNIQDGAVIHCTYLTAATIIGNNVSIGHNAIVHGCVIQDNVLIGMGAIVMDHAKIGSNSIIAAGAVVLENTEVAPGTIYAGVPARRVKDIPAELISGEINRIADNYVMYAGWYKE